MASDTKQAGLKVIIVGGGIGGLTAALALRQQGHTVDIYESSGFSKEIGAAINTAPNANKILKRLGVSCKDLGANPAEWMSEWSYTGIKAKQIDLAAAYSRYSDTYRYAHRVRLHDALRKAATGEEGKGLPAQLHLSKAVKDVDVENAIVYFKDDTTAQGDVVIGADGVHSVTRTKLSGGSVQPFASGLSAFRFLVPREVVASDPQTGKFVEFTGNMHGIFGPDRSVIMYPTSDNTILNVIAIYPDSVSTSTEAWGSIVDKSRLLEVYKTFHPDVLALLEKADESSLKTWRLLDMAQLPVWHEGRLAVIGDAAHPFLPFLGQGGAIAIEDAVSIGLILEEGLSRDEIPDRLKLYQEVRKERAELVQEYTRLSGKSRGEKTSFDRYCFGWNEWDHTIEKLKEWKAAKEAGSS